MDREVSDWATLDGQERAFGTMNVSCPWLLSLSSQVIEQPAIPAAWGGVVRTWLPCTRVMSGASSAGAVVRLRAQPGMPAWAWGGHEAVWWASIWDLPGSSQAELDVWRQQEGQVLSYSLASPTLRLLPSCIRWHLPGCN